MTRRPDPPMSGRSKAAIVIAVVAIGAMVFALVSFFKDGSVVHNSDFDRFLAQVTRAINDERYEQVSVTTNDDRTKVVVKGKVPSQVDLDELRAKIDAATPKGDYEMAVTLGARKPR